MEITDAIRALEHVSATMRAIELAQGDLHQAIDGYGCAMPTNAQTYLARVHMMCVQELDMLRTEISRQASRQKGG